MPVFHNRGNAYIKLRQRQRAIEDYDEAIRLNPQLARAYAHRAIAHTFLGEDVAAQKDIERAIELGFARSVLEAEIERLKSQR